MTDEQRALLEWIESNATNIAQGLRAEARACKEAAVFASTETSANLFADSHRDWMNKVNEFEALLDAACD